MIAAGCIGTFVPKAIANWEAATTTASAMSMASPLPSYR